MNCRTIQSAVVTGPTGAIGRALLERLAEENIDVYPVIRPGSSRTAGLSATHGIHPVVCDVSALSSLPELIPGGIDAFFHLAWTGTTGERRNDMLVQSDNIRYTVEACRAAKALDCKVFVGAGSQAEYGRVNGPLRADTPCFPENGYGMAKLCAGQMSRAECAALGIDHIWPRILSVYGPWDGKQSLISSAVAAFLAGGRLAATEGTQLWDYLYSGDAAEALLAIARRGRNGAVYPLGSGQARPLRDYILELRDAVGPDLEVGFGEIPFTPLQVMHLEADITALREDTGFCPGTDFRTGIQKTIQWMRSLKP